MAKKTVSFTVEEEVVEKFNRHCDENSINKSNLVEKMIKRFLEEKKR
ncbi:MAG: ribbon-helix-helix domain-containing protein [Nanoarchaeota archaeon]